MIGRRLGEFNVLAKLGRGGMGSVYLARDAAGERVALKVLDAHGDHPEKLGEGLKRFAAELEGLRRVNHTRIVKALGPVQYAADHHFFPMEYVRGRNLAQVLEEVGRLERDEALELVAQALDGLDAAHAAGVLHRDLKCANLLVTEDGHVKVCDFGLARAVDQTRLTLSGHLLGTPAYLSPEQARGHDCRVESDLYSMGVVLYEALTGSLPFRAETPLALLRQHLDDAPDPPSSRRPDLPPEIDELLAKALHKDPTERFRSATEMREAVVALRQEARGDSTRLETAVRQLVEAETLALEARIEEVEAQQRGSGRALAGAMLLVIGLATAAWFGRAYWQPTPPAALTPAPAVDVAGDAKPEEGARPEEGAAPGDELRNAAIAEGVNPSPRPQAEVVLRSGGTLRGELLSIDEGTVRVRTATGDVEHPRADVVEIRYGR